LLIVSLLLASRPARLIFRILPVLRLFLNGARIFAPPRFGSLQHWLRQGRGFDYIANWSCSECLSGCPLDAAYFRPAIHDDTLTAAIEVPGFVVNSANDARALNQAVVVDNQNIWTDSAMEVMAIYKAEK
jgi:hypothetical protein